VTDLFGQELPRVVGLDVSLTSTGLAWPDNRSIAHGVKGLTDPKVPAVERGKGLLALARHLLTLVMGNGFPVLVLVEDFPPGRTHFDPERGYLWWALVNGLTARGVPVLVVTPATLKKYATGRGNAGKAEVADALVRRLPGFETKGNSDQCDAAWLCAIGCALLGQPLTDVPQVNRDALKVLTLPEGIHHHA